MNSDELRASILKQKQADEEKASASRISALMAKQLAEYSPAVSVDSSPQPTTYDLSKNSSSLDSLLNPPIASSKNSLDIPVLEEDNLIQSIPSLKKQKPMLASRALDAILGKSSDEESKDSNYIDAVKNYYGSMAMTPERIAEGQQAQIQSNLISGLGKAGETIAAALSKGAYKPNTEFYDQISAQGALSLKNALQEKEGIQEGLASTKAAQAIQSEIDANDPNSKASKRMMQVLRYTYPNEKFPDNLSYKEIKDWMDSLEKKNRNEMLQQERASAREAKRSDKQDRLIDSYRKELANNPHAKAAFTGYNTTGGLINALDQYIKSAGKNPYGSLDIIVGWVKAQDPGSVAREGEVALAGRQGSVVSRMKGTLSQMLAGEGSIPVANAKELRDLMKQSQNRYLSSYETATKPLRHVAKTEGLDLQGIDPLYQDTKKPPLKEQSSEVGPHGKTVSQNGKTFNWNPVSKKYEVAK